MTVYRGVDFHARQRTVCYSDTADRALHLSEPEHEANNVRGFYSRLTGEVIVGIEAGGYSTWFIELLEALGHRVLIGDAAEVRRLAKRRQKNDRQDAGLILDLLLRGEFPQVHRPSLREPGGAVAPVPPPQAGADAYARQEQPPGAGLQRRLLGGRLFIDGAARTPTRARAPLSLADDQNTHPA
jgi:hypothetical protein